MDAQGRGRAENVDPADQWVLNPQTGDYELRLHPSAPESGIPSPRRSSFAPGRPQARPGRRPQGPPPSDVPGQRRRRMPEEPMPGRRRPKQRKSKGKKALMWTGGALAFLLVGGAATAYFYIEHLNGNLNSMSTDGAGTGGWAKDRAINVLVVGTDKRTGKGNKGYGDAGSPGHADTTILLHVSKDRTNATALSIPRDMIVDIPDCPTEQDGETKVIPGSQNVRFNESLGQSGRTPSCTMRTVTELTGVELDNFMVADFNAVKTLSSAVGGVDVCLEKPINDPKSHLKLPKGDSTVEGDDALAFVRTRHAVGFGSDLDRIKLQQQFLSSLMRKMKSKMTDPGAMLDLAEAATKALTVDETLSDVFKLRDLGTELGKVNLKNISFTTVPVVDNTDGATVLVNEPKAKPLFAAIKGDVSLTATKQKKKDAEAARLKGTKSAAADVRVNIYNGSDTQGAASKTLTYLQTEHGMNKASQLGNHDPKQAKTTLEYSPDQADQARKLAEVMGLPGSALKPGKSETNDQGLPAMVLILGADFSEPGTPVGTVAVPDDLDKTEADKKTCAK
ncbi:LCP family protein [Streptomyces sp. TRM66268-LWL]|uniref:LCP family protein n=1 Tax=Streptomyces polyasparticus TaxID=2767826 RepID=A0ABR7SPR6_9ACTN|nr:LCP family protein [Streptomyces polyasparticus]MBC9716680.1 LCP family protein [Streptomyces polyasparticus]